MSQEEKLFFDHRFPSQAGANHLPTRFVTSRESYVEKVLEIRKKNMKNRKVRTNITGKTLKAYN